ncbi:MAG: pyridoxamine 5'-phosphate oxidase family protein [Bryobacterales bacterium]|nr:pyridoxamine 5'-phosphate oxidase family protein [Bryobacterales bacterium]
MTELKDAAAVRAHYGEPSHMAKAKQMTRLDRHCRAFIALSPLVIVATVGADGRGDASPRGDAPGFVAAPDDTTLLIPDRIGNRRADTILNIAANPQTGLLFLVPGIHETLRVNGTARITVDPSVLAPLAVAGKMPVAAILLSIEEVFFHCGKPLIRADLWNPDRRIERSAFPSLGKILADQIEGGDAAENDRLIEEQYRTRLY